MAGIIIVSKMCGDLEFVDAFTVQLITLDAAGTAFATNTLSANRTLALSYTIPPLMEKQVDFIRVKSIVFTASSNTVVSTLNGPIIISTNMCANPDQIIGCIPNARLAAVALALSPQVIYCDHMFRVSTTLGGTFQFYLQTDLTASAFVLAGSIQIYMECYKKAKNMTMN